VRSAGLGARLIRSHANAYLRNAGERPCPNIGLRERPPRPEPAGLNQPARTRLRRGSQTVTLGAAAPRTLRHQLATTRRSARIARRD
jgi:hypothetical protein